MRYRLRNSQSHLDLQIHRHDPPSSVLPQWTRAAGRRRRARPCPGRWAWPQHRCAGRGKSRMAARVEVIDGQQIGTWELPAVGVVNAPTAVLIRPDGYGAWVGDLTQRGLAGAVTTCFGPAAAP